LTEPAASTHPYPAQLAAVAAVEEEGLSVGAEVGEGISPDPEVVYPSAYPTDHSYVAVAGGNQADSYQAVELGKPAAVVAVSELVVVGKLLQRQSQVLRLKQDP
jgi:hypothetical protein